MFKTTHKRRATTLSKTLLTAGLLGGAFSAVSVSQAKAITVNLCETDYSSVPQCESLDYGPNSTENLAFGYVLASELNPSLTLAQVQAVFPFGTYTWPEDAVTWGSLDILNGINPVSSLFGSSFFYDRGLGAGSQEFYFVTPGLSNFVSVAGDFGPPECESAFAPGNPGNPLDPSFGGVSTSCGETYTLSATDFAGNPSTLPTSLQIDTRGPKEVPAPLPLLGVGAAFGSIRKLRKFSSQLKTFSMG